MLDISALLALLMSGAIFSVALFLISYLTNDYWDSYGSVTSIEGGFVMTDQQWQEGSNLNFSWILVLFVLFDVELVMLVAFLFSGSQVVELIILVLVLFGSVLLEWSIHSLNW